MHYKARNCNAKLLRGSHSHGGTLPADMHTPLPPLLHFQEIACAIQGYHRGDRKIKRPFPPTASAHPMPPRCHPARCCSRLGSARTPRASSWTALDAAGRPPARTAAHGQDGWQGTGSRHSWSCSGGGCSGVTGVGRGCSSGCWP